MSTELPSTKSKTHHCTSAKINIHIYFPIILKADTNCVDFGMLLSQESVEKLSLIVYLRFDALHGECHCEGNSCYRFCLLFLLFTAADERKLSTFYIVEWNMGSLPALGSQLREALLKPHVNSHYRKCQMCGQS